MQHQYSSVKRIALNFLTPFLSFPHFCFQRGYRILSQTRKGTFSKDKNELLAQQFQMNYDDELAMFRKGSSVYREKVETVVKLDDYGDPILKRIRLVLTVAYVDIIRSEFWQNHQHILREGKCRQKFMKKFDTNHAEFNYFSRFSTIHSFDKPNDTAALRLMDESASLMMVQYPDIAFGFGFGSEYSADSHSHFIVIAAVLCSMRGLNCMRDKRGHTRNQYNTCFWMLVKSGKREKEAHETLKGTLSKDKNELLFQQFQINYNNEPAMFRKGSCVFRQKVEELRVQGSDNGVTRERWDVKVDHVDMGPGFWRKHPWIFLGE
ncbi:hypothetical protein PR202_gb01943 [Eleusine coracana subsp. coracana]|uniref:tRNA(His) guanylyltransferase n=1 Tax=Eleusine coracana subsp. coracana TaxID=191504 RepID=A0AAV5DXR9_ELECO|nr:hypothetical protein PR202_gb01943 [Eleusine coracana subsp. coracana]